ncbi:Uncharacterised protein [Campylobacter hyointestinalis subsp. hyointestinalis]|nr:Uncharacterised protein [Campylobacter hyointestinalis subsp. hyointestinalis]
MKNTSNYNSQNIRLTPHFYILYNKYPKNIFNIGTSNCFAYQREPNVTIFK